MCECSCVYPSIWDDKLFGYYDVNYFRCEAIIRKTHVYSHQHAATVAWWFWMRGDAMWCDVKAKREQIKRTNEQTNECVCQYRNNEMNATICRSIIQLFQSPAVLLVVLLFFFFLFIVLVILSFYTISTHRFLSLSLSFLVLSLTYLLILPNTFRLPITHVWKIQLKSIGKYYDMHTLYCCNVNTVLCCAVLY